jgi:hypothetical protein
MGATNTLLEGDALTAVKELTSMDWNGSRHGHIVEDTRGLLQFFHEWRVNHVKREGNMAAHGLVREALLLIIDRVWLDVIPDCICDTVLREQYICSFCLIY